MLFVILWIMLSINYDGMLNDLKVDESDQARSNLVQKVRKKSEADDETLHDRLLVGRSDLGQQVIEGWKKHINLTIQLSEAHTAATIQNLEDSE